MDTAELRLIYAAKALIGHETFTIPASENHEEMWTRIYGAFACGINVYLNTHTDQGFIFGAVSIQMKQEYTNDMDTVAYFCLPRLGLAVPLRPGDILFFYPLEPHCVSSRCKNMDELYIISLYMKTANLGLNDNSKELLPKENDVLDEYNKVNNKQ